MSYNQSIISWLNVVSLSREEYIAIKKIILENHADYGVSESERYRRSCYEAMDLNKPSEYDAHLQSAEKLKEAVFHLDEEDYKSEGSLVNLNSREVGCISIDNTGLYVASEIDGVEIKRTYLTNTELEADV